MAKKSFEVIDGGRGKPALGQGPEPAVILHKYSVSEDESVYWEMASEAVRLKMKLPDYIRWIHRNRRHILTALKPDIFNDKGGN